MKFFYTLFFSIIVGNNVYGADILELVRLLDSNNSTAFKAMIVSEQDANAMRDDNNKTILMYASWIGNSEAVEYLVSKKADVNTQDSNGATALHLAIWKGHDEIALYLLRHNASANAMSKEGMTPLDIAMMRGNQTIIHEIQDRAPKLKPLL